MIDVTKTHHRIALYSLLLSTFWLALYSEHLFSAIRIWIISEFYHHCLAVIPISLYAAWKKRDTLKTIPVRTSFLPLIPLLGLSIIELLAAAGRIQVVSHMATFLSVPFIVWTLLGWQMTKALAFPLGLLIFAIPVGEEIVPQLQIITAQGATVVLNSLGVPVFKNGLFLEIPEGKFVVAEACSGIKFFITATFFGTIYAYFTFSRLHFIFGFILASAIIAIAANILRVFVIIMIGRHFGMEYAAGSDHLMYGWLLFVVIIILLLVLGETLRRFENPLSDKDCEYSTYQWQVNAAPLVAMACLLLPLLWKEAVIKAQTAEITPLTIEWNERYTINPRNESWKPQYNNAEKQLLLTTIDENTLETIDIYLAWYPNNIDNAEMISFENSLFPKDTWSITQQSSINNDRIAAHFIEIVSSNNTKRGVIYWYELDNLKSANATKVKIYQALNKFLGKPTASALIVISTQSLKEAENTKVILRKHMDMIDEQLEHTFKLRQ